MIVEKIVNMNDEAGLESLNELKGIYSGLYYLDNDDVGHMWEDNGIMRVIVDEDYLDRIVVYRK